LRRWFQTINKLFWSIWWKRQEVKSELICNKWQSLF
jgi:hypothetical protein